MQKDFQNLIDTLQESIFTWEYFSDFEKVKKNVDKIERELSLLNTLIGKENIEEEFLDLIEEYPKVRNILPILIAIRKDKISKMQIISDVKKWEPELKKYLFYDEFTENSKKELLIFFRESGLKEVFQKKNIKSVTDYVFGVEVGMDTNGRKNRTGDLMEDMVEEFILDFCNKNQNFEYLNQATKNKIKEKWNYNIEIDKNDRKFDFAVFNKDEKKLFIFETNYYSGGGSKLKSVAGEFKDLYFLLKNQELPFYWITDGNGWLTAKAPLKETFDKIEGNIFNIEMLKNNILEELLN
jgi:type II restriction enzyme